jgi:regulator of cell morphogenesis and NO signaling
MHDLPGTALVDRCLGDLVQDDDRAARVFDVLGLNYCCDGRRTVRQAAEAMGLSPDAVVAALQDLGPAEKAYGVSSEWDDLRVLIRHVQDHHHAYVRSIAPSIHGWLDRLVEHHGGRHPELTAVRDTFRNLCDDLATHMLKEEHLLFPCIADLEASRMRGSRLPGSAFGTILNPIKVLETDHVRLGALATRLRRLTDGFTAPPDACATYRLCYAELGTFERDLRRHVHLENNVLFPSALEVERTLM